MNTSWGSPQNYYHGDRWSPDWCSNTKIPLFLHLSAPPVDNGAHTRFSGNKMFKLTSTYEGLSIGPSKKKPCTEVATNICHSPKSFLNTLCIFGGVTTNPPPYMDIRGGLRFFPKITVSWVVWWYIDVRWIPLSQADLLVCMASSQKAYCLTWGLGKIENLGKS